MVCIDDRISLRASEQDIRSWVDGRRVGIIGHYKLFGPKPFQTILNLAAAIAAPLPGIDMIENRVRLSSPVARQIIKHHHCEVFDTSAHTLNPCLTWNPAPA